MKFKTLKAGDIRKEGDEVRSLFAPMNDARHNPELNPELDQTKWRPTELVGHEIFQIDLAYLELRRPIK